MGLVDDGRGGLWDPDAPERTEPGAPDALEPTAVGTPPLLPEHAPTAMAKDPDPGRSARSRTDPVPDSAYTVARPGAALPWPPVPPTFPVAWAWTSTAHLSTTVMTSFPPPEKSARTLVAWPVVCATTTTIGDRSATPTAWSDGTGVGHLHDEGPGKGAAHRHRARL